VLAGLWLWLGSGLDSVFKQCSICRDYHWHYANAWPRRQFIIISRSPSIAGDFHISVYRCCYLL